MLPAPDPLEPVLAAAEVEVEVEVELELGAFLSAAAHPPRSTAAASTAAARPLS
ncbi:MAG TPA: hypothetical protein VMF57_05645 [Solirubrobacteraceae bacterium]|nr:hypothetical protein [Solirubrobacteraceae bacterium]